VEASRNKWKQMEASGNKWQQLEANGKKVEASGMK
jgi:hypothetical protein